MKDFKGGVAVVRSGNTSIEDLDKFSERFIDTEDEEGEDTGGQQQEQDVTVTTATTRVTTEQGWVKGRNAASLPVSLVRTS